jgi:hypothetical protein
MTPVEELLEQTLARAAASVGARSGLAETSMGSARRIRARRRLTAASAAAVCAVVAVGVIALVGTSDDRSAPPIQSSTAAPTTSASASIASFQPSPSPSPTVTRSNSPRGRVATSLLPQLGVLVAEGTTIYDGHHAIELKPKPDTGSRIETLARITGGYLAAIATPGALILARVDPSGNIHELARASGTEPAGVFDEFGVSADGKTIAYARWIVGSTTWTTTVYVVDADGRRLQSKHLGGPYLPRAVNGQQVWLDSVADDAVQPPIVWDRASGPYKASLRGRRPRSRRSTSHTAGRR